MFDVSETPINHPKAIEVSILRISHLSKSKVISIWIDGINTPIRFLSDQLIKALKFFVVNYP